MSQSCVHGGLITIGRVMIWRTTCRVADSPNRDSLPALANGLNDRADWELFQDGCPDGEAPGDVAARADDFIAKVRRIDGDVLAFSSGHVIRMIAARWLGLPPGNGRFFYCRPASVGVLAFEHGKRDEPIIGLWNYVRQQRE